MGNQYRGKNYIDDSTVIAQPATENARFATPLKPFTSVMMHSWKMYL